ncbi:hypothetical protein V6N11_003058 [Hibiscus sabdariffa]|uniref:Uncharacterized protein n=1 Tax=Hibiscus sabdariffa TaxID=183260 RepID=A0ABR2SCZ6_9ROSI
MVVILSLGLAIFAWEGMRELSHMKEEVGGEVGITGTGTGTANGWSQKVESDSQVFTGHSDWVSLCLSPASNCKPLNLPSPASGFV